MKITLLTVGRTDRGWVGDAARIYASRLGHYITFAVNEIHELKNASSLSVDQIRAKEGELILKAVGPADEVILLDERGRELSSSEFAREIQGRTAAGRDLVFVVGGPYGFSPAVYDRANSLLSLSRMTFPHQMVRVVFLEQLYRAFTIIRGEPYHHE